MAPIVSAQDVRSQTGDRLKRGNPREQTNELTSYLDGFSDLRVGRDARGGVADIQRGRAGDERRGTDPVQHGRSVQRPRRPHRGGQPAVPGRGRARQREGGALRRSRPRSDHYRFHPFDIPVPKGDLFFDPNSTGTQVIPLDRSNFNEGTGPKRNLHLPATDRFVGASVLRIASGRRSWRCSRKSRSRVVSRREISAAPRDIELSVS